MPFNEVSITAFTRMHNQSITLFDVREVDEYELGHVPGAINIPMSRFSDRIGEIPNKTVYFICHSGGRSMRACELCVDYGFADPRNIAGGTMGWIAAGNNVVTGGLPG